MPTCCPRFRLLAAALMLAFVAARPATAGFSLDQPKAVADLQLMTAGELSLEAHRACGAAVGSRMMADNHAAVQLGKRSSYGHGGALKRIDH